MEIVEAKIEKLNLDLDNPRFAGLSSTRAALISILVDQGQKLVELADDIVQEGLSPAHQILAIPGQSVGSYVIVDGNRRLAALKILINPSFLDGSDEISASIKKQFQKLSEKFDRKSLEPIRVALLDTRDEANRWIELIHTGENKGRGVVDWDGVATARFRGRSPAIQVLEMLRKNGSISEEDFARFPITNLGRLLGTPEVRTKLGVVIEDGKPKLLFELKDVEPMLSYVVSELGSGRTTVSQLKGREDRVAFVNSIPKKLLPKTDRTLASAITIDDVTQAIGNKKAHASTARSANTVTVLRKTLIPSVAKCKLSIPSPKVLAIATELRKLEIDKTPNAVAVLLRVFIELSMDVYARTAAIAAYDPDKLTLSNKVLVVADYLQANGLRKNDLAPFRRAASAPSSPLYVDRLHKFVHNSYALPTSSELRTGWDEVQHVFEHIWG